MDEMEFSEAESDMLDLVSECPSSAFAFPPSLAPADPLVLSLAPQTSSTRRPASTTARRSTPRRRRSRRSKNSADGRRPASSRPSRSLSLPSVLSPLPPLPLVNERPHDTLSSPPPLPRSYKSLFFLSSLRTVRSSRVPRKTHKKNKNKSFLSSFRVFYLPLLTDWGKASRPTWLATGGDSTWAI